MKSKKSLYLLIPAVLIIWGYIIYLIVPKSSDDEIPIVQSELAFTAKEADANKVDTLKLNYDDPFLKSKYKQVVKAKPTRKSAPKPKVTMPIKAKPIAWPKLTYQGFIKNNDRKKALVQIGNHSQIIAQGESVGEEYKIVSITNDSIVLANNELLKTYYK